MGILSTLLFLGFNAQVTANTGLALCNPSAAATQTEMNQCQESSYRAADEELNRVYQRLLSAYSNDSVFIGKLREAQRAWIRFRDAELAMKYPPRNGQPADYGSMGSFCLSEYLEKMTYERIATLRQWLNGAEEGDVCSGSIMPSRAPKTPAEQDVKEP